MKRRSRNLLVIGLLTTSIATVSCKQEEKEESSGKSQAVDATAVSSFSNYASQADALTLEDIESSSIQFDIISFLSNNESSETNVEPDDYVPQCDDIELEEAYSLDIQGNTISYSVSDFSVSDACLQSLKDDFKDSQEFLNGSRFLFITKSVTSSGVITCENDLTGFTFEDDFPSKCGNQVSEFFRYDGLTIAISFSEDGSILSETNDNFSSLTATPQGGPCLKPTNLAGYQGDCVRGLYADYQSVFGSGLDERTKTYRLGTFSGVTGNFDQENYDNGSVEFTYHNLKGSAQFNQGGEPTVTITDGTDSVDVKRPSFLRIQKFQSKHFKNQKPF
ncbi:MAG: hypothetical protein HRU19_26560 [Pseudobacteriovorax sp.]|nr:hypothetical protein [Pseudobacteriovorax sp.]